MCDDMEERKKIYSSTKQDLLTRNLSNSEKYDNAILTLSSGILAISLAFIKDIVPLDKAFYIFLLIASWCLFGAAIVSTLVSFVLSQIAIKRQLEYAGKYYLENKEEYLTKKNRPAFLTDVVNYISGILFIFGIVTTIIFVSLNIQGGSNMTKDHKRLVIMDGAPIPSLEKIETDRGACIPEMQPVKQPAAPQKESSSQSTQTNTEKK